MVEDDELYLRQSVITGMTNHSINDFQLDSGPRLHDQYWNTSTPKAGTRYERLVAFVLKALDENRID